MENNFRLILISSVVSAIMSKIVFDLSFNRVLRIPYDYWNFSSEMSILLGILLYFGILLVITLIILLLVYFFVWLIDEVLRLLFGKNNSD